MIDPRPTYNNKFMFQKIFTELDYLAGGILLIPAGCEKPQKPAKDNSYVRTDLMPLVSELTTAPTDVLLHRGSRICHRPQDQIRNWPVRPCLAPTAISYSSNSSSVVHASLSREVRSRFLSPQCVSDASCPPQATATRSRRRRTGT